MLKWLIGVLLSPLTKLGEKYLDNQKTKEELKAATDAVVYNTDAAVKIAKQGSWLGRLPLFLGEVSCVLYIGAILVDSAFPMEWLTPLELPTWFKPHFHIIVMSIFGIATFERVFKK